ncbi:MAG: ferredoxin [Bilifractor sp.]|jgi:ferredoxin
MKANVDQDICVGCGMCTGIAPDSFQMNDEGKAEFIAESDDKLVQEAIDSCPVSAISKA